jgi:membrane associated rhomboid family serine protease
MTPTPVGMRCPECARQRTRVTTARAFQRGAAPLVTYGLIAVNVAVEVASIVAGGTAGLGGGTGGSKFVSDLALNRSTVADGDWWRLVTSGFLHYGLLHLAFNMFSLYILGSMLEPAIGRLRFGLIYFVSLLGGSFGALLISPNALTAGASGAIFGLLGAAVVVMRNRGIDIMQSGLGIWLIFLLFYTFAARGISIGGHLGGLFAGALAAYVMVEAPRRLRMPAFMPNVLVAAIGVAAFAGSLALSSSAA